jgi:transposase-like protein
VAAKKKQERTPWFGDDGACVSLGDDVRARGAWGDETDARFQEYVAREHIDGGMPVVELHRNHGIALSAVKRWIETFEEHGRKGLEEAAAVAAEKEAKRVAALLAKKVAPEEIARLTTMVESADIKLMREAYATIGKQRIVAMVPVVVDAIRTKRAGFSIQDELELLATLRAKDALQELASSKLPVMKGYENWMPGLLRTALKP